MRWPTPTGATSTAPAYGSRILQDHEVPYKNNNSPFNLLNLLMTALGCGKTIWTKVDDLPLSEALPLVDLTFLLDEHIKNLTALCALDYTSLDNSDGSIISDLLSFYKREELPTQPNKRGRSLREIRFNSSCVFELLRPP